MVSSGVEVQEKRFLLNQLTNVQNVSASVARFNRIEVGSVLDIANNLKYIGAPATKVKKSLRYPNSLFRMTRGVCGPLSGRRLLSGRRRPGSVLRDPPLPRPGDQLHRVAARLLHHHERHQPDHCHHPGDPGPAA